jgi:glycosyltransferase involved in cell wall biosynthesis
VRVLHIQKAAGIGGCERHLLILLPALAEAGVEVKMCVAVAGAGETFVDQLRARGIPTVTTPAGPDVNPRLAAWIRREIRRYGPDLVHTHLVHADLHGQIGARLAGTPFLSTVHGPWAFARAAPYRIATRLVGAGIPLTIAISHHVRRVLEASRQRRPGTVRVVHYGIDTTGWLASDAERATLRRAQGLEEADVAVAICARLIPGKGHELLLEAMAPALQRWPTLRLLVAGDGPLRGPLERRAGRLPRGAVRFLGFVDDLPGLLKASDVLAFPTSPALNEGFGLAALEAMAAGRAVVAANVGPLPEIVADGRTGILVPAEDPSALADALVGLAGRPEQREAMGREGHNRAEAEFGIDAMVRSTLEAYRTALADSRAWGNSERPNA